MAASGRLCQRRQRHAGFRASVRGRAGQHGRGRRRGCQRRHHRRDERRQSRRHQQPRRQETERAENPKAALLPRGGLGLAHHPHHLPRPDDQRGLSVRAGHIRPGANVIKLFYVRDLRISVLR
jgi:hypothetical protein